MAGNVWEWTADYYDKDYYAKAAYVYPFNSESGVVRVIRGGSWSSRERLIRTVNRGWDIQDYSDDNDGFRCALNAEKIVPKNAVALAQATGTQASVRAQEITYQMTVNAQVKATQNAMHACVKGSPIHNKSNFPLRVCDDFTSNDNGWYVSSDNNEWGIASYSITNGSYIWDWQAKKGIMHRSNLDSVTVKDFEASLLAQRISGTEEDACYGMVFRKYGSSYYWFEVCDNQQFSVSLSGVDNKWETQVEWTKAPVIKPGQPNWLTVVGKGNHFIFYINNKEVGSIDNDESLYGTVGLGIELSKDQSAQYSLKKFIIFAP